MTVDRVKHIPGADNWRADLLSRKGIVEEFKNKDQSIGKFIHVELNGDKVVGLCNAKNGTNSEANFISMWLQMRQLFDSNT